VANARPVARPLSPHLSIWKWRVTMAISIMHRATGTALAVGGVVLFLWWLVAAATGPEAYACFYTVAHSWFGALVGVGLTWSFFQHMLSGIRHLYMDTGAGFALDAARRSAIMVFVGAVLLTALTWAAILATKGF
jgi:succinate dehydrogenase / fumarate reductase, cytochrome b subunit